MNPAAALSPSAITQLRVDHAQVMTTFQQYELDAAPETKRLLVHTLCRALEMHSLLEEEIFYPAVYQAAPALIEKNVAEQQEWRRAAATLIAMEPTHAGYDRTLMDLMRSVMHHVADEETLVFPQAQRLLGARLDELGARMAARRLDLTLAVGDEIARDTLRVLPTSVALATTGALIAGTYVLTHALRR